MSRWVAVAPERLAGWLDRFAATHGAVESTVDPQMVRVVAADGTVAELMVPFPPLRGDDLVGHALAERRVGVLLVRLGGYAAGVFAGTRLVASKVGSRQVHGRSAAGGQSQQRFARRREGQARQALGAAADTAAAVLLPAVSTLDAVVLGGDRRAADEVLADPRLAPLRPLVVAARLDVPDPRLKVLQRAPEQFRAVRIKLPD
jgi:predicted NBD/HSP70 family sugar kinase